MRSDIIKIISNISEIRDIIILTYNVDLMFIQSMLLPKLKNCGHPNLMIFSDYRRATETYQSQHEWVQGIGSRYRLVPVSLAKNGSFHPKAVLLSSEEKATLLVGSGNLSFAGWRENGETWIRYDSDNPGETPVFSAFRDYLNELTQLIPLNSSITGSVKKIYSNEWALNLPEADVLFGRIQDGPPLIDKMFNNLDLAGLERITICTPFFDPEGEMVREIFQRSGRISTRVLVQNKKTNLTHESAKRMPEQVSILPIEFSHEDADRHSFLHSKFYAFEKNNTVDVFLGSANCSRAALKASGDNGNAELLTKVTLTKDDYENLLINELQFVDCKLVLPKKAELESESPGESTIKILAARQSGSEIRIAYSLSEPYKLAACYINDQEHNFNVIYKKQIAVPVSCRPYNVYITAIHKDMIVQSPMFWVDDEIELQITSRDRKLANTIDTRIKYGQWSISGWIEIMRLIHTNLDYESNLQYRKNMHAPGQENGSNNKKFKYEDIFSDSFEVSAKQYGFDSTSEHHRLQGFQQTLLSWFGVGWKSDFYSDDPEDDGEGEEGEDQNEKGRKQPKPISQIKKSYVSTEDKDRALRVAWRIVDKITSDKFLESRPPALLGIDLSIIGTLLCSGLSEKWLRTQDFFELTYEIWHTFFFDPNLVIKKHGWIERLHDDAEDSDKFESEISSIELSSILIMWVLAAQQTKRSNTKVLFLLAYITSISRTPWLWNIEEMSEVLESLWRNLVNIKLVCEEDNKSFSRAGLELKSILQRGLASKQLFDHLNMAKISDLRNKITRDKLDEGEILWQGAKHGLCILCKSCNRSKNDQVYVLSLNDPKKEVPFQSSYLLPVNDLLNDGIIPLNLIGEKERKALSEVFNEISSDFDPREYRDS
jgi:HKD family nuclease